MGIGKWLENLFFLRRYGLIPARDLAVLAGRGILTGSALLLALLNPEPVGAVLGLCLSAWLLPYAGAWMHSFFMAEMQDKDDMTPFPLDQFLDEKNWQDLDDEGEDVPFD